MPEIHIHNWYGFQESSYVSYWILVLIGTIWSINIQQSVEEHGELET